MIKVSPVVISDAQTSMVKTLGKSEMRNKRQAKLDLKKGLFTIQKCRTTNCKPIMFQNCSFRKVCLGTYQYAWRMSSWFLKA